MEVSQRLGGLPGVAQPWYQVWADAVTKPRVQEYEDIISRSNVSLSRACLWVFLSTVIGSGLSILLLLAIQSLYPQPTQTQVSDLVSARLLPVCLVPAAGIVSVLGLILATGISHLIARALGGTGSFTQLAYATAAYTAPVYLMGSLTASIPIINCLGLPIGLYTVILNVLAIRAVHRITWGRALLSSVAVLGSLLGLAGLLLIVALALLGPS